MTALVRQQGSTITVRMSTSDCSPTATPQVLETATVVVVGATQPVTGQGADGCAAVVRDDDVTVVLSQPLGRRILTTAGGRLVLPAVRSAP